MIVHEDPGIDRALTLRDDLAESFEEPGFVFVVSEDVRLVDPPDHDVVKGAGDVQSCLARHGWILSKTFGIVKLKALYEPTSPSVFEGSSIFLSDVIFFSCIIWYLPASFFKLCEHFYALLARQWTIYIWRRNFK